MSKSTPTDAPRKQKKHKGPLTPHPSGRWCKKIRGKLHYFGPLSDKEGALAKFHREWPYLSEGKTPPWVDVEDEGCRVKDLLNAFHAAKKNKLESGEMALQTFADYRKTTDRIYEYFGGDRRVDDLRPDDFEGFRKSLAKRFGIVTLRNEINRARVVFKFAHDQGLIDKPVTYGQSFDKPSAKTLRKARHAGGPKLFTADELRRIIDEADPLMRSMVLLALNSGFGNTDVASLPQSAIDLQAGWCEFPRPKTEIPRRVPLWPETIEALRKAIGMRPAPKDRADANLCFITIQGNRWVRTKPSQSHPDRFVTVNTVAGRFGALLKRLGINGRKNLGFYTLRHVFQTVAGESKDQVAVNAIMGHADHSMAAVYRESISDERLRAVVDTVHRWLWPPVHKTPRKPR